jgi:hypothetical protein
MKRTTSAPALKNVSHNQKSNEQKSSNDIVTSVFENKEGLLYKVIPFAFIILSIMILYSQCANFEFLWWDDRENIFDNVFLQTQNWTHFWETDYYGLWIPIPYTLWTFIWSQFPNNPGPFHLVNILFHGLNCVIVYMIISYYCKDKIKATVATLLFVIHPLQVETVAWVSGLRDTMGYTFGFLTFYLWLNYKNQFVRALAFGIFIIALLCKPTVAVLPILYMVLTNGFKSIDLSFHKIKLYVFPILSTIASLYFINLSREIQAKFVMENADVPITYKPLIALDSWGFYWQKLFMPFPLSTEYGRIPSAIMNQILFEGPMLSSLLLIGLIVIFYKKMSENFKIGLTTCILLYLPTSGIITFAYQNISTTADRYFYAPMLGVAIMCTAIPYRKQWHYYATFATLIILSIVTFNRIQIWENNKSFFMDMLKSNPNSYSAHLNMGNVEKNNHDYNRAIEHFEKAHEIRPTELGPIAGKMMIFGSMGNIKGLEDLFNEYQPKLANMRTTGPHLSVFYAMLAHARLQQQKPEEAFQLFCEAYKFDPSYHDGKRNLDAIAQNLIQNNKVVPNCPVR